MNFSGITHVVGALVCFLAVTLFVPLGVSFYFDDGCLLAFATSICAMLGIGGFFFGLSYFLRGFVPLGKITFTTREGMAVVALGWLAISFASALPFWVGHDLSFVDSVFEAVSGITTTGGTILVDIEILPQSLLFWRAEMHWIGGLGFIVLSLAILPFLGVGGMQLYRAEVAGPMKDKLTPRIKDTAAVLWKIYIVLTLVLFGLLLLGGMNWFDAIAHTFSTVATGGFSTKNASIGAYESPFIQWVIILFMIFSGINFALLYKSLIMRKPVLLYDTEIRVFFGFIIVSSVCVFIVLFGKSIGSTTFTQVEETLRASVFQVTSLVTSTGFATYDYALWPHFAMPIFLLLTFVGGCAGSTSGGFKCIRLVILLRLGYRELFRVVHPQAITPIKIDGRLVSNDVSSGVIGFIVLYCLVGFIALCVLTLVGIDVFTAFSAVIANLSNVGPGFGSIGPAGNYAHFPTAAKYILSACMLLGRLEFLRCSFCLPLNSGENKNI